jgi:integrase/recombinase XerD
MLAAYRRHRKDCVHHDLGWKYRRCRCPIWARGFIGRKAILKSLGTLDWDKAQKIIHKWEAGGELPIRQDKRPIPVVQATKEFLADSRARNLRHKTIYKYQLTFRQLVKFGERLGIRYVKEFDTRTLQKFRASWKDKNLGALKKLERLRSFFRFANLKGWIADNPATEIKIPKISMRPTSPFSPDEMLRILTAIGERIEECRPQEKDSARRLLGLVLLLRYSGLRIGDAVSCSVDRLAHGKIRLSTQKTGTCVDWPLPEFVVTELGAIPKMSKRYWFWSGTANLQTAVGHWHARLFNLFKDMKITEFARTNGVTKDEARKQFEAKGGKFLEGPSRRFRDTFAVELLLAGVSVDRVSILLGHSSLKTTEKHYAPWLHKQRELAEAEGERTWAQDPIALLESQRTPEVHGKRSNMN